MLYIYVGIFYILRNMVCSNYSLFVGIFEEFNFCKVNIFYIYGYMCIWMLVDFFEIGFGMDFCLCIFYSYLVVNLSKFGIFC